MKERKKKRWDDLHKLEQQRKDGPRKKCQEGWMKGKDDVECRKTFKQEDM